MRKTPSRRRGSLPYTSVTLASSPCLGILLLCGPAPLLVPPRAPPASGAATRQARRSLLRAPCPYAPCVLCLSHYHLLKSGSDQARCRNRCSLRTLSPEHQRRQRRFLWSVGTRRAT